MNIRETIRQSPHASIYSEIVETFFEVLDAYLNEVTSSKTGSVLVKWLRDNTASVRSASIMLESVKSTRKAGMRLCSIVDVLEVFNKSENFDAANAALRLLQDDLRAEGFGD